MKIATCNDWQLAIESFAVSQRVPCIDMAVVKKGVLIFGGHHEFNLDTLNFFPNKPRYYLLSSITKTITASAIMRLHERGLIDIKASVADYLTKLRFDGYLGTRLKIIDLLSHSSGIGPTSYNWITPQNPNLSVLEAFECGILKLPNANSKQGKFLYTNRGYDLLGALVEKVSGNTFAEHVMEEFFKPLGIEEAIFNPPPEFEGNIVKPHIEANGEIYQLAGIPRSRMFNSSATCYMSVDALHKWGSFHASHGKQLTNTILNGDSMLDMQSPRYETSVEYCPKYGLGWFLGDIDGRTIVGHGGREYGYNTLLMFEAASQTVLALLTNIHRADTVALATKILRSALIFQEV